jgi:hypothetical protein
MRVETDKMEFEARLNKTAIAIYVGIFILLAALVFLKLQPIFSYASTVALPLDNDDKNTNTESQSEPQPELELIEKEEVNN